MDIALTEYITSLLFSKMLIYMTPTLFLFTAFLFADKLIVLLHQSIKKIRSW